MNRDPLLARCLSDRGYTPSREEVPRLLAWLPTLDDKAARQLERVLCVNPAVAADAAIERLSAAGADERRALYALLGRVALVNADARLFAILSRGLEDGSPRARRAAVNALAKLGDARAEPALLALLADPDLALTRSVVDALGKVGGPAALAALETLPAQDPELERRRNESRLLLSRRLERDVPARLELSRRLPQPARIVFNCRRGLAELLCRELSSFGPELRTQTRVEIQAAPSMDELLVARTALNFGIVVELDATEKNPAELIAQALTRPAVLATLKAWSDGPLRFRLEWTDGAHHRSLTWKIAERVRELRAELNNDPRAASWIVRAAPSGRGELLLMPRLAPDPRFAYRRRDVPAASHPTIAAALAQCAPLREDEVVWDPFVGSGLELIERARRGSYRRLVGSDLDPRALDAARENLESAAIDRAELRLGDALTLKPEGVTLILTNPPLGRRVARDGSIKALLAGFVTHAARTLQSGGRLIWLSPLDRHTAAAGRAAGLEVEDGPSVDMGGFDARLQIMTKR